MSSRGGQNASSYLSTIQSKVNLNEGVAKPDSTASNFNAMERESQNINTYIVSSQSAPDQAKQSRIVKLSTKQEAPVPSKTKKSEESSYFRIAVKPQLTPLNVAKISSSDKIEVKAKSPVFSHNQSDSPSNPSNAPFA